jgi:hypothetical protein
MNRSFTLHLFTAVLLLSTASLFAAPITHSFKDSASFQGSVCSLGQKDVSLDYDSRESLTVESSGIKILFASKPLPLYQSGADSYLALNRVNPTSKTVTEKMAFRFKSSSNHTKSKTNFFSVTMAPGTTQMLVLFTGGLPALLYQRGCDQIQILMKKSGVVRVSDSTSIQWISLASPATGSWRNLGRGIPHLDLGCHEPGFPCEEAVFANREDHYIGASR